MGGTLSGVPRKSIYPEVTGQRTLAVAQLFLGLPVPVGQFPVPALFQDFRTSCSCWTASGSCPVLGDCDWLLLLPVFVLILGVLHLDSGSQVLGVLRVEVARCTVVSVYDYFVFTYFYLVQQQCKIYLVCVCFLMLLLCFTVLSSCMVWP